MGEDIPEGLASDGGVEEVDGSSVVSKSCSSSARDCRSGGSNVSNHLFTSGLFESSWKLLLKNPKRPIKRMSMGQL